MGVFRSLALGVADDALGAIPDAAVRALVSSFLAENHKLKSENTCFSKHRSLPTQSGRSSAENRVAGIEGQPAVNPDQT
jgi:hypothetical protein